MVISCVVEDDGKLTIASQQQHQQQQQPDNITIYTLLFYYHMHLQQLKITITDIF